jgi:DNA-directed RNA polymerase subunit M/transcription elongation factor TFIIS
MINEKIRKKIIDKFFNIFGFNLAEQIEKSIYMFSEDYAENNNTPFLLENIYISKADELFCLLNNNLKNAIIAFKNNKLDATRIAFLKPSDLSLTLSNSLYVDIIKKRELNMMLNEKKGSVAFECKKCKKRKCSITEKQVRSADEPATQFINCLECGYTFTI